jgi:hypothetical protein
MFESTNAPVPSAPAQDVAKAPTSEPAITAPVVETPKKEDAFSPRFAALSRQEKQLRERESTWKAQREAQEREWAPRLESARKVEELKAKAKTDRSAALELLKEVGLSFDELTKMQLNGGKPTPEMIAEQTRREVEAIRAEQRERDEKAKTDAETAKQTNIDTAVSRFKGQIGEFLKSNPDMYELTANHSDPHSGVTGADLMYQVIDAYYDQTEKAEGTGRVLSHEDAAKAVEEYLEKDIEEKILSRKKIQAKFGKLPGAPAEGADPRGAGQDSREPEPSSVVSNASQKQASHRTLTNQDQSQGASPPKTGKMTREERLRESAKSIIWK